MTLIQLSVIVFSVLILIRTIADFKKNRISLPAFLSWITLWFIIIMVAVLPQVTVFLERLFGAGRGLDAPVYFAIILIFFILFKIIIKLERIDREITEIVRSLALKTPEKKTPPTSSTNSSKKGGN